MNARVRKTLGRLFLAVLAPAAVVAAVETALRLADAGRPTAFLVETKTPDGARWIDNQYFGLRFFPPWMTRMPAPISCLKAKPAGTIRIVVLGESAAMGEPSPEFGPARRLEAVLRGRHPGRRFEVINAAMTAVNSHVLREIARDVRALDPDVAVIYMGNNEVVGPFGPGAVTRMFSDSDAVVRGSVLASRLRLAQWLRRWSGSDDAERMWGGMEMFTKAALNPGDAQLDVVRARFRRNLHDIVRTLEAGGTKVMLCTMAVNLSACPPFASVHREDLQPQEKAEWEQLYAEACLAQEQRRWPAAWASFERAAALDDRHAELQYRIAQTRSAMQDEEKAARAFREACDLDALRFRADSGIQAMIMSVISDLKGRAVPVDIAALFASRSPAGVPGAKLFLDHVHFSREGTELWAEGVADAIAVALNLQAAGEGAAAELPYTDGDEMMAVDTMIERMKAQPFSGQLLNRERLAQLVDDKLELLGRLATSDLTGVKDRYEEMMRSEPGDWWLPWIWGRTLDRAGRYGEAVTQLERAVALVPHRLDAQGELALAMAHAGRVEEGVRRVVAVDGAGAELPASILLSQAQTLAREGAIPAALAFTEAAFGRVPDSPVTLVHYAEALLGAGRRAEARKVLEEALQRGVDTAAVFQELGMLLAVEGDADGSDEHFERALELSKDGADVRMQRALARLYAGRAEAARADLEALVQERPDHALAYQHLGWVKRAMGDRTGAEVAFTEAMRCAPGSASVRVDLARVASEQGRDADALLHLRAACELEPDRPDYLLELARRLLAAPGAAGGRDAGGAYKAARRGSVLTGFADPQLIDVLARAVAEAADSKMAEQESMAAILSGRAGPQASEFFQSRLQQYRAAARASAGPSAQAAP